ncbi:MAG: CheB methylesterase domain-containing protein [Myxococcota bacterium]
MTAPSTSPQGNGPVLIVEASAAVRNRLRAELAPRHVLTMAQTIGVARSRAEEARHAAAVVTTEEASPAELELVQWLARQQVPVLAVIRDDSQRRRLLGAGAALALVRPPNENESEAKRHLSRIVAWLDAVARSSESDSQRPHATEIPPRLTLGPTLAPARHSQAARRSLLDSSQRASKLPTLHPAPKPSTLRVPPSRALSFETSSLVVCIGISTGGPEALETLFRGLPASMPPIVIVQHMPVGFTAALARRLDNASALSVREASDEQTLYPGLALIAPGGIHLRLKRQGFHVVTELFDAPPVLRHRPSVNVLFESAAEVVGAQAIGVIMTGMGDDGTRGVQAMKARGALTIAQDAEGCAVFGMPQRAIASGAVDHVVPLDMLAQRLVELSHFHDSASHG